VNIIAAAVASPWLRRVRNFCIALIALLVVYALLGFLLVPWVAKSKVEIILSTELGRSATLGKVDFNPFTLRARFSDFTLADREPGRALLRFDALDLALSSASLWHWAPVFDAVRLTRPQLALVRSDDGSYNIQDLIERATSGPAGPTPLFSIYNIEIDGGSVSLDDRQYRRKVAVTDLGIGIPFLSSIPHDAQIRVTPRVGGSIDGARFDLAANSSTPFAEREDATLDVDVDALPLPHYAEYVSLPHGLKLADGALTTRLKLAFVTEKGAPRRLTLSGSARLDHVLLARSDGSPLAAAKAIDTVLTMDPVDRTIVLDRLGIDGPAMDLRRFADGTLEIERLLTTSPAERKPETGREAPRSSPPAPPWTVAIAEGRIGDGTLRIADEAVSPAFRVTLSNVAVDGRKIASNAGRGTFDASFDSDDGAHFGANGDIDLAEKSARGHFSLTRFRLAKLYPYYAEALNLDVRRGTLDFAGDFEAAAAKEPMQFTVTQGGATFNDLEMALPGERDPLWRIPRMDVNGVAFDLAKRRVAIERTECRQAAIRVVRQADGVVNFARLVRATGSTGTRDVGSRPASPDTGWSVVTRKLLLERVTADVEDRVPEPDVKLRVSVASLSADNISNERNAKGTMDATARIGTSGRLHMRGAVATNPLNADLRIDANGIDLVPLRPYFEAQTNIIVTSGAVAAKGRVVYTSTGPESPSASYAGDVTVSNFGSLDRPTSQELVRWKTLTLTGVDTQSAPVKIGLGAVALDQFYARLILDSDATLNLHRLLAPDAATPAPAPTVTSTLSGAATAELPPPRSDRQELPVSIGRIQVSNGEVQFSDFFVKPNYSAHLMNVAGGVSALSATQAGEVDIAASVEGTAPVQVGGTVNPFARELALDLTAKARDIDLPPLTPYSVKYAGYGIQKGKLSLEVHYRIDNRKLAATNKLVLDQLTFGEHVESPTATKLPVLLVVSLLKDRNGVINLDLPIEGTLDDPKFSIWGVIVQIVANFFTKAATSPFALLGAVGGGGGEQLAYVEFAPGRADLSAPGEAKLRSLAKALTDRPGLKLDAAGRAVADIDREGLKRVALDRAVRAQKQKALLAEGASAPSLDALTVDAAEYPKYLAAVYRETKLSDKPRNVLGFAKEIPPAEMEALLLASYGADDEALRGLANRRAQTVKEWLVDKGSVASERIFVVAAKLSSEGISGQGAATRVDFAIR
jgi:uncharacterized protein involved in outer membrane biogenesis